MAKEKMLENEGLTILMLFMLSSTVFFASTGGLFGSNAGSHYALIRAIAEKQSFTIDEFVSYTGGIDMAKFGDKYFSDRAPGLAIITTPFYAAGRIISAVLPFTGYLRGWDPANPGAFTALLLSTICGGLSVVLLYLICRRLDASQYSSTVAALTLAFATLVWKYATVLLSHSVSTTLALAALYMTLSLEDIKKQKLLGCALFFTLGYLPLLEYPNMLLTIVFLTYLTLKGKIKVGEILPPIKELKKPLVCLIIPLAIIPAYNIVNFGDPFTTAYKYSIHHPWVGDLSQALSTPWTVGISGLLFGNPKLITPSLYDGKDSINGGLLTLSPILLLSLWGIIYLYRKRRDETLLMGALFLVHLAFYCKYKAWSGGAWADTRYLLTVTPFLVIPLAAWVDDFLAKQKGMVKTLSEALMWILFTISVVNVAADIARFEGHGTKEFTYPALNMEALKDDVGNIFPNLWRTPAYLGIAAIAYAAATIALKRAPADLIKKDKELVKNALAIALAGAILFAFFTQTPADGYNFNNWRTSTDGVNWANAQPPINAESQRLFVKATIDVGGPGTKTIFNAAAQDCIKSIRVNDMQVFTNNNCTVCMHCGGGPLDISQMMSNGLNKIEFEIEGLGKTTRLEVNEV